MTTEQKTIRLGRFCGSEIHKLMGHKGLGKNGETYIQDKVAEYFTGQPVTEEFTSAATTWGINHEPEAILHFESATGQKVSKGETIDNGIITGTPDGFIVGVCGFEIKCPYNSGNHLKNLLMQTPADLAYLRPEYYWQITAYMWLTGLEFWKFCSYDPRFKEEKRMLILNVPLEEGDLKLLQNRVAEAKLMFDNIIDKLK